MVNPIFPNDEKYLKIIKNMPDCDFFDGNCGMFAIFLNQYYKTGKFVAFNDPKKAFYNVLYNINNKYYDAFGIYTKEEIIKKFGLYGEFIDDTICLKSFCIPECKKLAPMKDKEEFIIPKQV